MNTLNKALAGKLDSLRDVIRGYEKPCIAFPAAWTALYCSGWLWKHGARRRCP